VIRKGKATNRPSWQDGETPEAEQQIITAYVVYEKRPVIGLLIPALDAQAQTLGRVPRQVAADAAFYSGAMKQRLR